MASIPPISEADRPGFVRRETRLLPVAFVPEVMIHQATDETALWHLTERALDQHGLPPPFWAFPWAGGQALARHILDHPEIVSGKRVVDFASGSGLVAIAAVMAGGVTVTAVDVDPFAAAAIAINADANDVRLTVMTADIIGEPLDCDVFLAGDVFYDRALAARLAPWLDALSAAGTAVIVGDPDRAYRPRSAFYELARYQLPVHPALEDAAVKDARVLRHHGLSATG